MNDIEPHADGDGMKGPDGIFYGWHVMCVTCKTSFGSHFGELCPTGIGTFVPEQAINTTGRALRRR